MTPPERAVCVVFDGDRVLVIRRRRGDRRYTVLPGGGVEPGETPAAAAVRELAEETDLQGVVTKELAVVDHDDRRAHYFLLGVDRGELALGGPEADRQDEVNVYLPTWIGLTDLDDEPLVPAPAKTIVLRARRGR